MPAEQPQKLTSATRADALLNLAQQIIRKNLAKFPVRTYVIS